MIFERVILSLTAWLDHCNSLCDVLDLSSIQHLQLIQNTAACPLTVTPVVFSIYWVSIH